MNSELGEAAWWKADTAVSVLTQAHMAGDWMDPPATMKSKPD